MNDRTRAALRTDTSLKPAMPPRVRPFNVLMACAMAWGLAACGGGGGGGDEVATDDRLQLTSSNYVTAGNEAVDASESGTLLVIDAGSYLVPETAGSDRANVAAAWQSSRRAHAASVGRVQARALYSVPLDCPVSGSLELTISDSNGNEKLETGDYLRIDADHCTYDADDGGTYVNDGRLKLTLNSDPDGDLLYDDAYDFDAELAFDDYSIATSDRTAGFDGTVRLRSERSGVLVGSDHITAGSFTMSVDESGSSSETQFSSYDARVVLTESGTTWTLTATIDSSRLSSREVDVTTGTAFARRWGEDAPYAGSLTGTGANGSQVTVTVLVGGQVRYELDVDGDGTAENTTVRDWGDV